MASDQWHGADSDPTRQVDFLDDGVLWAVNRAVFHPRGFALATDLEVSRFWIMGDGRESWQFGLPAAIEDQRFEAFQRLVLPR